MKTLQEINDTHSNNTLVPSAWTRDGITKPEQLTPAIVFGTPGFGHTSIGLLAITLAKEVARLQRLLDHINQVIEANK